MSRRTLFSGILFLSLLGIADAWYLAQHAITNTALSCGIDGALSGCNVVAQSPYSHFFGIPLGVYGIGFYGLIFIAALFASRAQARRMRQVLFAAAAAGVVASSYFIGIQIFVIDALCIYCIGSFALSVGIFLCTVGLWRRSRGKEAVAEALPAS